jgi:hypothetical protein
MTEDLRIPALQAIGLLALVLAFTWAHDPPIIRAGVLFIIVSIAVYGFLDPAGRIYRRRNGG